MIGIDEFDKIFLVKKIIFRIKSTKKTASCEENRFFLSEH